MNSDLKDTTDSVNRRPESLLQTQSDQNGHESMADADVSCHTNLLKSLSLGVARTVVGRIEPCCRILNDIVGITFLGHFYRERWQYANWYLR